MQSWLELSLGLDNFKAKSKKVELEFIQFFPKIYFSNSKKDLIKDNKAMLMKKVPPPFHNFAVGDGGRWWCLI